MEKQMYHVRVGGDPGFEVNLIHTAEEKLPGNLISLNLHEAAVSFAGARPELRENDKARLEFIRVTHRETFLFDAELKSIEQKEGVVTCLFGLHGTDSLRDAGDQTLFSYFNRRGDFRTKPDPDEDIPVTLRLGRFKAEAILSDISISGIGLRVTEKDAAGLGLPVRLIMVFRIPGEKDELRVTGRARYCKPHSGYFHYGIEFLGFSGFSKEEKAVAAYVFRLQQRNLQQQAIVKYSDKEGD